jgi:flagellar M-ring protein FliF
MDPIDWAMVQIDIPEETLFDDSKRTAVASVTLDTHGPISSEQVRAIQNIVATADANLSPENVRVIDTNLTLLSGESMDPLEGITIAQLKVKKSYESQLEQKAIAQLLPIVGDGKARVKVDLDLDFQDREIENNEIDPNTLVTIQEDVTTENSGNVAVAREPGVPANLTGQEAAAPPTGETMSKETTSTISKVSEKKTVERIVGPKILRMTVSVVVDGKYAKEGGAAAFEKRPQEELDQIQKIVGQALGYNETRDGASGIMVACAPFESIRPVAAGFGAQALGLLGSWRAILGPLVLILVPFACYVLYKKIDRKRESVREDFQKRLQKLARPSEAGEEEQGEDIKFGVDLLKLPEEERRTYKMQQKLVDYAKRNPKDFAQVLKAWIRE